NSTAVAHHLPSFPTRRSSDLAEPEKQEQPDRRHREIAPREPRNLGLTVVERRLRPGRDREADQDQCFFVVETLENRGDGGKQQRSEERRVGKEWRTRRWRER